MAGDEEQAKPIRRQSPTFLEHGHDQILSPQFLHKRRRKFIQCCGCLTAIFLILAVLLLVLAFTIFRVQDPKLNMTSIKTIQPFELVNGNLNPDVNMTFIVEVSMKNSNHATFRYGNTTTSVYYHGTFVGEGNSPFGKVKARRTVRLNITVDMISEKLLSVPNLGEDLRNSESLMLNSLTKFRGKVRILGGVKKSVEVQMNCTVNYNISSGVFRDDSCIRRVEI